MKKVTCTGGIALLALIGAVKVAQGACAIAARALTIWGGWAVTEAAQAAPALVFAIGAGLALLIHGLKAESKSFKHQNYGKVDCTAYRAQRKEG